MKERPGFGISESPAYVARGVAALAAAAGLADLGRLAVQLAGVTERRRGDLLEWRYRGRLVARQLDQATS